MTQLYVLLIIAAFFLPYIILRPMNQFFTLKIMVYVLVVLISISALSQHLTARDVIKKASNNMRGNTSQAEMIIRTIRPTWTREMTVKSWSKGENYAMILIKSPARDKGVAFLKRSKEVWNWVPTLERSIKLPPSMMAQSWMGTDFTNDDLVRESSTVEDYEHSFAGDTIILGYSCYIIQMIPKPDAAIVWGKLLMCVEKKNFIELHTRFYDEEGELINVLNAFDVKPVGGRMMPTRVEMVPADKKNQRTEIIYSSISFDKPIDDKFFTLQQLKNLE